MLRLAHNILSHQFKMKDNATVIGPHGIYALFCADFGRKSAELKNICNRYNFVNEGWKILLKPAEFSLEFCGLEFSVGLLIA